MKRGDYRYIWQASDWPEWRFDLGKLVGLLADVGHAQGKLLGRLADVGLQVRDHASLGALTHDVLKTSEIEGEVLDANSVRSSVARRLGIDIGALTPVDRRVEGVVDVVLDATTNAAASLTRKRLFAWHAALFPTGYSGMAKIIVGGWRDDSNGPMQVVSGPIGGQRVHFEAPPAVTLDREIERFLTWANAENGEPSLIRAGLAHLWFVTLHPFDDGNGRIARAIGDLMLARGERSDRRFYSVSAQIQRERVAYYDILERTQRGTLDVTEWLLWFLGVLGRAIDGAHDTVDAVLRRARLWQQWAGQPLNERQAKVLNRLVEGFDGKLTTRKWAAMAKCSQDTALRDISELIERGILRRTEGGGRSAGYELV